MQSAQADEIDPYRYERAKARLEALNLEDDKLIKQWKHNLDRDIPNAGVSIALGDIADEMAEVERSIRSHERDEG